MYFFVLFFVVFHDAYFLTRFAPKRVLVFVGTHSHPKRGELWVMEPGTVTLDQVCL